jgi:hypothetical protein
MSVCESAISYLNERNPTAAANLDAELTQCIERLADQEFEGSISRLRSGTLVRSWAVPPFRILLSAAVPTEKPVPVDAVDLARDHIIRFSAIMSVVIALLLTLRSCARSRAVLQLELLPVRHQLHVLQRTRPRRLALFTTDRWLGCGCRRHGPTGDQRSSS